jgi:hypothetical protein
VLVGQSRRSNAGLYYANAAEFRAAVDLLLDDRALAERMGLNGRAYYAANYAWPVIEQKYLDMFDRLRSEPPRHTMDPLPGFLARRARTLPAAADVLNTLPAGPVLTDNGMPS